MRERERVLDSVPNHKLNSLSEYNIQDHPNRGGISCPCAWPESNPNVVARNHWRWYRTVPYYSGTRALCYQKYCLPLRFAHIQRSRAFEDVKISGVHQPICSTAQNEMDLIARDSIFYSFILRSGYSKVTVKFGYSLRLVLFNLIRSPFGMLLRTLRTSIYSCVVSNLKESDVM